MTDPPQRALKLRRLNDLRRKLPHISASAMGAILADVASEGTPELHSRRHIAEASFQEISSHDAYGPLLGNVAAVGKQARLSLC